MLLRTLITLFSLSVATAAVAEVYTWKDAEGHVHYSDQPPANVDVKPTRPSNTPKYAPAIPESANAQSAARASSAPAGDSKPPAAQSGPKTWQEKDLELKQRRAAEQEAEAKRKEEETRLAEKTRYCDNLRKSIAMFERGGRISQPDARGEPVVMGDAEMKQEADRLRGQLARDCK
ncbi:MAG: hypothetical protein JWM03_354 [Rhodocyclales bacterium]|nr:hypothetical protein [Rhodocyclales bacterium]